ncbi:unnamed protein product [Peniophora sp. CBMAI 1063]|nr:unnamed protein product [Peniophora sp. CBMAI 1063]
MDAAAAQVTSETPLWLAGASQQRVQEISHIIASRAPYNAHYAASIASDASALSRLAKEFLHMANAYTSPILRLSPELVGEVFYHVARMEPTDPTRLGWVRLGHVCHAFRAALLGMRTLWASAVCHVSSRAFQEVLNRAGNAPITIYLKDEDHTVNSDQVRFVSSNMTRARDITIEEYNHGTVLWTIEPRAVSGRAFSFLEELNVQALHRPLRDFAWLRTDVYDIAPIYAPQLRRVRLINIFIPFPPHNLTSLSLLRHKHVEGGSMPNRDDVLPSPDSFLDLLGRCTNLDYLWLQDIIPALTPLSPSSRSSQAIRLPKLKHATLYASRLRVAALWSHLLPSPDAKLDIRPDYISFPESSNGYTDAERVSFLPLFVEYILQNRPRVTALVVEVDTTLSQTGLCLLKHNPALALDTWEGLALFDYEDLADEYEVILDIWFCQCIWDVSMPLRDLIHSIPTAYLADIDTLQVTNLDGEDAQHLFSRLPRLHTLHLADASSATLALLAESPAESPADSPDATSPDHYFPQLRHLRLIDSDITSISFHSDEEQISFKQLLDLASIRTKAGIPLRSLKGERLYLHDTDFDRLSFAAFIRSMKEIVPDVDIEVVWGKDY